MLLADIAGLLPQWMLTTARRGFAGLMAGQAALVDALTEAIQEGRLAVLPGQLDVPGGNGFDNFDALPLIGRDRGIRQGLLESPFDYAARLRAWMDEWAASATPFEVLDQLAAILSPNPPVLRLVNGSGTWWTRSTSGDFILQTANGDGFLYNTNGSLSTASTNAHAWVWDTLADPKPYGFGDDQRFWIIIYAPCNAPLLSGISGTIGDGRLIGMGKGGPDATTIGTVAPSIETELIRNIVQEWRSAGLRCSHIIITFGAAIDYFNPDGSSPDYPDGTWGWPCKVIANIMSPARVTYARFWRAEPGGVAGSN